MFFPWAISERDHEIQDPTSPAKIRLLGRYVRLGAESSVLDVGCGRGGPARILAAAHGCRITGVERWPAFAEEARILAAEHGLERLIDVWTADAATFVIEPGAYDVALCLGAAFVWGTIADAAAALRPAVRAGGFVAVGEPFWRRWPLPDGIDRQTFTTLDGTVERFEGAGFRLTGLIGASEGDWDLYQSLQWRASEEWLSEHEGHADAPKLRDANDRFRSDYLRFGRELLGWAIFVGRKTG